METPIAKRSKAERDTFMEGFREGAQMAATVAPIYEGQSDIGGRIRRAMEGFAQVFSDHIEQAAKEHGSDEVS